MNKEEIYNKLTDKDDKAAYEYMKLIDVESAKSDKYLKAIPIFVSMLEDKNSYVRTRGFVLICSQARWANDSQIKDVFNKIIPLLNDPKPTVVRQCLKALHELVMFRSEMSDEIIEAINKIDINVYKDSMSPLILKDIEELKKMIGLT